MTPRLWHRYDLVSEKQISATSGQVYYCCSNGNCCRQKILLPYKLNHKNRLPNILPPFDQGFVIIQNDECVTSVSKGLKTLTEVPSLLDNASIIIKIKEVGKKVGKEDKTSTIYLEGKINTDFLNQNLYSSRLDGHQDLFQYEIVRLTQFKNDGSPTYKNFTRFFLGAKQCKKPQGWIKADVSFVEGPAITSADDNNWLPILPPGKIQPISILFMGKEVKRVYGEPLIKRIIFTPFSIIADVFFVSIFLITGPPA